MKTVLMLFCATAFAVTVAHAQTSPTQSAAAVVTTTATTESTGTITEFTPGLSIVLNTGTGEPVRYKLGKSVTFVNRKGKAISDSKIKKGRKVRVHYVKEGNDLLVDKVAIVRD